MSDFRPFADTSYDALTLIIRHIQAKRKLSQACVGKGIGAGRGVVSDFLNRKLKNRNIEGRRYDDFAKWALKQLNEIKHHPDYLRPLYLEVYPDTVVDEFYKSNVGQASGTSKKKVIDDATALSRSSGYSEDDSILRNDDEGLQLIYGLSMLVRPSTEPVRRNGKLEDGVSLSVVNLVPDYVEVGRHHPVFKVRQYGAEKSTVIDIEGLVLSQDDRFVLSGRHGSQKRNMLASVLYNRENVRHYRTPDDGGKRRSLSGVMLGVSNRKSHFVTMLRLWAIPGGHVTEDDIGNPEVMKAWYKVYENARRIAGVHAENEIPERLAELGITGVEDILRTLLDKTRNERVFEIS